jgi:hypothetical protein
MTDPWWTDEECAPALHALVHELDTRDEAAEDAVLWQLLCAAWPTPAAQVH